MRVLVLAVVAVVAFAGAASAQEAQMAAEGEGRELVEDVEDEARDLMKCGGRRLGEPETEVTDGRDLQVVVCSKIKCKTKCNQATGCSWSGMPKRCRTAPGL
jgi:hypothetical protein